jgi:hypothetical protein
MQSHVNRSFLVRCASGVAGVVLWNEEFRGDTHGRETTTATAGTDADQGRRKRTARPVQHNVEEFTLNFVYIFPNGTQGKLLSSVIVSPGHAKRIWRALGENISRYEAQFGPIKEAPEGANLTPPVGFVQ